MKRQDFVLIASIIRDFEPPFSEKNETLRDDQKQMLDTRNALALEFASVLGQENALFDRERFLKACDHAPWDHPYEAGSDNICITCGQVGSYAHTNPSLR